MHGYVGFCELSNMRTYLIKDKKPLVDDNDAYVDVNEDPKERKYRLDQMVK